MDWDDIRLFLTLVRAGTVRKAASKLGVSHSTVARRVEDFERKLGVRLFDRLPTGYATTAAGDDMVAAAEKMENEADALERRIVGQDRKLAGNIRVTMVDVLATHLLMPDLAEFTRRYPDIDLEIVITYEPLDLSRREADIALRFTTKPPEHLIGRRLATAATAAYGSRTYLQEHDLTNAASACWIGFGNEMPFPKWIKESGFPHLPARGMLNSMLLQFEACKAGMGLGMLPCFLGDAAPSLRRLSPSVTTPHFDLWLLSHRDMRTTARIRVFSDFIAAAVKARRALLEGRQAGEDADAPQVMPSPKGRRRTYGAK